jgi:hypothetical protein
MSDHEKAESKSLDTRDDVADIESSSAILIDAAAEKSYGKKQLILCRNSLTDTN